MPTFLVYLKRLRMTLRILIFTSLLLSGLLSTASLAVENEGDDPLQWLRDSIPGEPGVDYPIFSEVGETNFECNDKVFGGKH